MNAFQKKQQGNLNSQLSSKPAFIKTETHKNSAFIKKLQRVDTRVFEINGRKVRIEPQSYFVFSNKNKTRLFLLKVVESKPFQRLINLCILVNSIMLAMHDYSGKNKNRNRILDTISNAFTIIYAAEFTMKSISYGVIFHKHSYLRSRCNFIDFVILIAGIAEFFTVELIALRTIRVLRPLKSVSNLPSLRNLVKILF